MGLNCLGLPLDVEIFNPYWQETWNFIFWIPSPKYLLVATKIEKKKMESKSIFQGKTSQMGCGWLDFVEFLLYHT